MKPYIKFHIHSYWDIKGELERIYFCWAMHLFAISITSIKEPINKASFEFRLTLLNFQLCIDFGW